MIDAYFSYLIKKNFIHILISKKNKNILFFKILFYLSFLVFKFYFESNMFGI